MFYLDALDKNFSSLFDGFGSNFAADIIEKEDSYEVVLDIPGVEKKDVDISLENRILTVSAKRDRPEGSNPKFLSERRWSGEGKTSYRLGFQVEEKDISAELNLGVLRIKIPKAKHPAKRIEIT